MAAQPPHRPPNNQDNQQTDPENQDDQQTDPDDIQPLIIPSADGRLPRRATPAEQAAFRSQNPQGQPGQQPKLKLGKKLRQKRRKNP